MPSARHCIHPSQSPRRRALLSALIVALFVVALPGNSVAANRKKVNSTVDATIRNGPPAVGQGYVIGNARTYKLNVSSAWTVDVQGHDNGLDFGYIWGNYNGCGWVYASNLTGSQGTVANGCMGTTYVISTSSFSNGEFNCSPGTCSDGSNAHINYNHTNCAATGEAGKVYANVRPWLVPAQKHDYYGQLPHGAYVKWRYVTRDGNWVMVRDPYVTSRGFTSTASDWYFVRRQCLNLF